MRNKPDSFNKEIVINDYVFYQSDSDKHGRVYVPRIKEDFNEFIEALWSLTENPTDEEKENYELIKKYPFLLGRNRWDDGIYLHFHSEDFNRWFATHELSWLMRFDKERTLKLLQDLTEEFDELREDFKYYYMIRDTKEKWGMLRWYDSGNTDRGYEIIEEYCAYMSKYLKNW